MNVDILALKSFEGSIEDPFYNLLVGMRFIPDKFGYINTKIDCNTRIILDFEIIYFEKGKCEIIIEDKKYMCTEGDLMIITPFIRHQMKSDSSLKLKNYYIHFDVAPIFLHNDFVSNMQSVMNKRIKVKDNSTIKRLFKTLKTELRKGEIGHRVIYETVLLQILTLIYRENSNSIVNTSSIINTNFNHRYRYITNNCVQYIYDNIEKKITPTDLCKFLDISQTTLLNAFKFTFNLTPVKFVQLIKVKYAEQLLKTKKLSVREVSELLGFSSPFYFSKVFKSYFNCSPKQYIEK